MCLSTPYLIFCDILTLKLNKYNSSYNESYDTIDECSATSDTTVVWNNISGWYPTIVSYILPVFVISYCYIRILMFLSTNSDNLRHGSVS